VRAVLDFWLRSFRANNAASSFQPSMSLPSVQHSLLELRPTARKPGLWPQGVPSFATPVDDCPARVGSGMGARECDGFKCLSLKEALKGGPSEMPARCRRTNQNPIDWCRSQDVLFKFQRWIDLIWMRFEGQPHQSHILLARIGTVIHEICSFSLHGVQRSLRDMRVSK
jgi:hypothetical protein